MNIKKIVYGVVLCLGVFIIVLFDMKKERTWYDFFKGLPPKESKLFEPSGPLSVTQETNERIKNRGKSKSDQERCTLFQDMLKTVQKKEEVSKVEPVVVQPDPIKPPKKVTVTPKKVVKKTKKLEKKLVSPVEPNYFPGYIEIKGSKKSKDCVSNSYISGCLYGTQSLKHGRTIIILVKEPFTYQGKKIPKGALLYGVVAFGKERVLSKLETAVFGKTTLEVCIALYDSDYTLGLLVENLYPFLDNARDKLLSKAATSSSNSWIQEISSNAIDALKSMKKEPKVTLENRRKVLLKPIKK